MTGRNIHREGPKRPGVLSEQKYEIVYNIKPAANSLGLLPGPHSAGAETPGLEKAQSGVLLQNREGHIIYPETF
ncbi:Alstrom Syndrome Protein 1 [Manis pentadactyla]|nr:Alstrom Syndrome Protein 1 [Manis pentadactyla]